MEREAHMIVYSVTVYPWSEVLTLVGPIVAAILAHAFITRRRP